MKALHAHTRGHHTAPGPQPASLTMAQQRNELVERWLPGFDEHQFYTRTYPSTFPRAVVLFVHGFSDHVSRYEAFHSRFAPRGVAVFTFDQRGYGHTAFDTKHRSKGASYARTSWSMHFKDLEFFARMLERDYPGVPLFMMGQSMVRDYRVKFSEIDMITLNPLRISLCPLAYVSFVHIGDHTGRGAHVGVLHAGGNTTKPRCDKALHRGHRFQSVPHPHDSEAQVSPMGGWNNCEICTVHKHPCGRGC